eukprot:4228733-Amphidinium_carterae.1
MLAALVTSDCHQALEVAPLGMVNLVQQAAEDSWGEAAELEASESEDDETDDDDEVCDAAVCSRLSYKASKAMKLLVAPCSGSMQRLPVIFVAVCVGDTKAACLCVAVCRMKKWMLMQRRHLQAMEPSLMVRTRRRRASPFGFQLEIEFTCRVLQTTSLELLPSLWSLAEVAAQERDAETTPKGQPLRDHNPR